MSLQPEGTVKIYSFINNWSNKEKYEIREILIPTPPAGATLAETLEVIFKFGQNDFQAVSGMRSLSVGDIVSYEGLYHEVLGSGWKTLCEEERLFILKGNVDLTPILN